MDFLQYSDYACTFLAKSLKYLLKQPLYGLEV